MQELIILIPLYREFERLNKNELASLHQCYRVLGNHGVCFLNSPLLSTKAYVEDALQMGVHITVENFDPKFFSSLEGYNSLLLSKNFYKRFLKYKYMLIHQTDCWVFRDELHYWCEQDYDYIGAPWFENYRPTLTLSPCIGVGNGGFSLRKIATHYRVCNRLRYIRTPSGLYKEDLDNGVPRWKSLIRLVLNSTIRNNHYHLFHNKNGMYEDLFFGIYAAKNFSWFHTADCDTASRFSLEVNAPLLYEKNKKLPFGCHAWEKYHTEFWKRFIEL